MNATETYQIQVDPDDADPDLEHELLELDDEEVSTWTQLKLSAGRFLHRFGFHTWVTWYHWDAASKRVLDMKGVICAYCTKAKLGGDVP